MIRSTTPFRVSFTGGGTDLVSYLNTGNVGEIVSSTINRYITVEIQPLPGEAAVFEQYLRPEGCFSAEHLTDIISAVKKFLKLKGAVDIRTASGAVPPRAGLGGSSSLIVGLLNALLAYLGKTATPHMLADAASFIEIEHLKAPIGKQDHYAAAFGGFNYLTFYGDGSVHVEKLEPKVNFEDKLILLFTGITRRASSILSKLQKLDKQTTQTLQCIADLSKDMKKVILGQRDIDDFGKLLHEGWKLKRQLTDNITSPELESLYDKALKAGATGGKILGAGGGGYFLFYCPDGGKPVRDALGLSRLLFDFERDGSKITWNTSEATSKELKQH